MLNPTLEERRSLLDRFDRRVDEGQLSDAPTKAWVGGALRREGAARCPIRLKSLSYDVILRYGDELADLFATYPDDIVSVTAYDLFVGYPPGGLEGPIDTVKVLTEGAEWTDEWGTRWAHAAGGVGATPIGVPLGDWSALDDYLAHGIPNPSAPGRLDGALRALRLHGDTRHIAGWAHMALFERLHCLHGMENTLEDLYASPREIARLLDGLVEYYLGLIRAWGQVGRVDVLFMTDDWGSQSAMMIAPGMWRTVFAPRYRLLCDEAHRRGLQVGFHSCGHVLPIIGDLIDVGVDIMNPLQPEAMDLRVVAREYGGKVAFWGGLSDQVLAVYSPTQVRDEVRRTIDLLGGPFGNAYVLALSNVMMPEVPWDNIVALVEACHDQ